MSNKVAIPSADQVPRFDRRFFTSDNIVSRIGSGAIGGKATGLAFAHRVLTQYLPEREFQGIAVSVPRLVVIGTDVFDVFMERNDLYDLAFSNESDDRIANAFQRAAFPAEFAGDLRGLILSVSRPLAVRSSSLLEDAMYEPFAGVYGTKMIPNNQPDTDARYRKLIEAVKFVYASAFFHEAKAYIKMTGHAVGEEKMAVVMQQIVGTEHYERFYPDVSGVTRSYNFYPVGHAKPEDGVVDLALGLGKTIVDGGRCWTYSPTYPNLAPPYTMSDMLKNTQTDFWAVNLGRPPSFDPIRETEYLLKGTLKEAEYDNTLSLIASTYQPQNDRLVMGIGSDGPRVLDFAPLIRMNTIPLNDLIRKLLSICSESLGAPVEIEFALALDGRKKSPPRFGFLQVRPMVVSDQEVDIATDELTAAGVVLASEHVLGNGVIDNLTDIVYVKPDKFEKEKTRQIAVELDTINRKAVADNVRYVLLGFGRWGSSDPWLGIPVDWGNISGARIMAEITLPAMNVELSQGSHFFHNLTSLQVSYFSIPHTGKYEVDWDWLGAQPTVNETEHIRHVRADRPLQIRVDGRSGRGLIRR